MLGPMYRWCASVFSSSLWNIPTPIDHVLDGRVVQTRVKIDALCEQRRLPEQHAGKKILAHVAPVLSTRTIGNRLLPAGLRSLVPLARLHDTAKHGNSGVVKELTGEWNGSLLSSVTRVGSVCMRVMDIQ